MKKTVRILLVLGFSFVFISCDAPSPFSWQGTYQNNPNTYQYMWANKVGYIEAEADPATVSTLDDRIIITTTVYDYLGRTLPGIDVTYTTDTGFFRSNEYGPSKVFTDTSDSAGKAYAHLLQVGRTTTIKIEAGGVFIRIPITAQISETLN